MQYNRILGTFIQNNFDKLRPANFDSISLYFRVILDLSTKGFLRYAK
jgi:hypothetical protein